MLTVATAAVIAAVFSACNDTGGQNLQQTPDTPVYSNEVQVVVLLGQSNAEGHTWSQYLPRTVGEEKAGEYAKGYDNVFISYACTIVENTSNGEFVPVKLGQGHTVNQFRLRRHFADEQLALAVQQKHGFALSVRRGLYPRTVRKARRNGPVSRNQSYMLDAGRG